MAREVKPEDLEAWTHEELRGREVHPGRIFGYIVENDAEYAGFILERDRAGRIKDPSLVEFASYCELVQRQAEAMTAYDDQVRFREDDLRAVIDAGCNNTCHGAQWLKKYMELLGMDIPLEPTGGNYVGVGGEIKVAGKRRIRVVFQLMGASEGHGVPTELEDSSAPLLFSTRAQRTLGLTIDLGEHDDDVEIYSKIWESKLEVINRGGLPAHRLLPGDMHDENIVLRTMDATAEPYVEVDDGGAQCEHWA